MIDPADDELARAHHQVRLLEKQIRELKKQLKEAEEQKATLRVDADFYRREVVQLREKLGRIQPVLPPAPNA